MKRELSKASILFGSGRAIGSKGGGSAPERGFIAKKAEENNCNLLILAEHTTVGEKSARDSPSVKRFGRPERQKLQSKQTRLIHHFYGKREQRSIKRFPSMKICSFPCAIQNAHCRCHPRGQSSSFAPAPLPASKWALFPSISTSFPTATTSFAARGSCPSFFGFRSISTPI